MDQELIERFEADLQKVAGVKSARVVANGNLQEIHILANSERSPKQIVRDIQSLATAGFGFAVDHRIVSVVQLDDDGPTGSPPRVALERVVFWNFGGHGQVEVALRWP